MSDFRRGHKNVSRNQRIMRVTWSIFFLHVSQVGVMGLTLYKEATWDEAHDTCANLDYSLYPGRSYQKKVLMTSLPEGETVWMRGWRIMPKQSFEGGDIIRLKIDYHTPRNKEHFICISSDGNLTVPMDEQRFNDAIQVCEDLSGALVNVTTMYNVVQTLKVIEPNTGHWVKDALLATEGRDCLTAKKTATGLSYGYRSCNDTYAFVCLEDDVKASKVAPLVSLKAKERPDIPDSMLQYYTASPVSRPSSTVETTTTTTPTTTSTTTTTTTTTPTTTATTTTTTVKPTATDALSMITTMIPSTTSTEASIIVEAFTASVTSERVDKISTKTQGDELSSTSTVTMMTTLEGNNESETTLDKPDSIASTTPKAEKYSPVAIMTDPPESPVQTTEEEDPPVTELQNSKESTKEITKPDEQSHSTLSEKPEATTVPKLKTSTATTSTSTVRSYTYDTPNQEDKFNTAKTAVSTEGQTSPYNIPTKPSPDTDGNSEGLLTTTVFRYNTANMRSHTGSPTNPSIVNGFSEGINDTDGKITVPTVQRSSIEEDDSDWYITIVVALGIIVSFLLCSLCLAFVLYRRRNRRRRYSPRRNGSSPRHKTSVAMAPLMNGHSDEQEAETAIDSEGAFKPVAKQQRWSMSEAYEPPPSKEKSKSKKTRKESKAKLCDNQDTIVHSDAAYDL